MSADEDAMLARLLAVPERPTDEAFALRIGRLVRTEQRLQAARRAAWRRFTGEMAAAAAALAAFLLIERLAPADSGGMIPLFGSAAMGLLVLALFVAVSIRPESSRLGH